MKVGIVHTAYLQKGGEDVVVDQEYQLLKKNGVNVDLLQFKNATGKLQQLFQFMIAFYNPFSSRRISQWIDETKPDVIHIHNWHYSASPSIIRTAKKRGIPVVHTLHNFRLLCPSGTLLHKNKLSFEYLNRSFPWKAVRSRVYHDSYFQTFWLAFTVWANKQAGTWNMVDKYIVLTDHAKRVYQSSSIVAKHKIAIKSNFMADVCDSQRDRQPHFLYTGRLSEEKGLELLLEAFARTGWKLKIVGDGPLKNLVEQYSEKYNNIVYLGFKDKEFIIKELKTCTALFSPLSGTKETHSQLLKHSPVELRSLLREWVQCKP